MAFLSASASILRRQLCRAAPRRTTVIAAASASLLAAGSCCAQLEADHTPLSSELRALLADKPPAAPGSGSVEPVTGEASAAGGGKLDLSITIGPEQRKYRAIVIDKNAIALHVRASTPVYALTRHTEEDGVQVRDTGEETSVELGGSADDFMLRIGGFRFRAQSLSPDSEPDPDQLDPAATFYAITDVKETQEDEEDDDADKGGGQVENDGDGKTDEAPGLELVEVTNGSPSASPSASADGSPAAEEAKVAAEADAAAPAAQKETEAAEARAAAQVEAAEVEAKAVAVMAEEDARIEAAAEKLRVEAKAAAAAEQQARVEAEAIATAEAQAAAAAAAKAKAAKAKAMAEAQKAAQDAAQAAVLSQEARVLAGLSAQEAETAHLGAAAVQAQADSLAQQASAAHQASRLAADTALTKAFYVYGWGPQALTPSLRATEFAKNSGLKGLSSSEIKQLFNTVSTRERATHGYPLCGLTRRAIN